jgi:uncharacterized protein (TIGR03067 family)
LQDFQGTWRAVWLAEDGRRRTRDEIKRTRLTLSGDRYTLRLGGYEFHGTITGVDPGTSRGAIDFVVGGGQNGEGRRCLGLYVLEGDEFTVCVAPPGQERPTAFESRLGSGHWLYLLKRCPPAGTRPAGKVLRRLAASAPPPRGASIR